MQKNKGSHDLTTIYCAAPGSPNRDTIGPCYVTDADGNTIIKPRITVGSYQGRSLEALYQALLFVVRNPAAEIKRIVMSGNTAYAYWSKPVHDKEDCDVPLGNPRGKVTRKNGPGHEKVWGKYGLAVQVVRMRRAFEQAGGEVVWVSHDENKAWAPCA